MSSLFFHCQSATNCQFYWSFERIKCLFHWFFFSIIFLLSMSLSFAFIFIIYFLLLGFGIFYSFFLSLRWELRLLRFFLILRYAFSSINFYLWTTAPVTHKFWCCTFIFTQFNVLFCFSFFLRLPLPPTDYLKVYCFISEDFCCFCFQVWLHCGQRTYSDFNILNLLRFLWWLRIWTISKYDQ